MYSILVNDWQYEQYLNESEYDEAKVKKVNEA